MSRPPWTGLVVAALAAAGCTGRPATGTALTPPDKLWRVLAIDFSTPATARRAASLRRAAAAPLGELLRARRFEARFAQLLTASTSGADRLPAIFDRASTAVADRCTRFGQRLPVLPTPSRYAANLARDLDRLPLILGLERRPLTEPSDPEHRTDPDDARPVATWWQRLSRRLSL
jgi:hypothetical protein